MYVQTSGYVSQIKAKCSRGGLEGVFYHQNILRRLNILIVREMYRSVRRPFAQGPI